MSSPHVLILAAGKGTRMKSALAKVLHTLAGRPIIEYVLDTAAALRPETTALVVGHQADAVKSALASHPGLHFLLQEPQLGTGHAVLQAAPLLEGARGTLLLLYGDVPLLTPATLRALIARHEETQAAATVVTAVVDDPTGYGRIVRRDGRLTRIVEHRDASADERAIREINSGIYAFDLEPLFGALRRIGSANAQGEYYLTDLIELHAREGRTLATLVVPELHEILGVNSRAELAMMSRRVWAARNEALMAAGVTIEDPATTYVDDGVTVGPDTVIRPGVVLEGRTEIGSGCVLHPGVRIVDSTLADRVVVLDHCLIVGSRIAEDVSVGPFAHLRAETEVARDARIGNFVELKKTRFGAGSKASHLSYLGDATVGEQVNIGAGTITCNYDGVRKNPTVIEDGAFIGSDSQLIAPVRVGRQAYVAAGSSITDDVPAESLAITRGRQVVKEGWVGRKKKKRSPDSGQQAADGERQPAGSVPQAAPRSSKPAE